MHIFLSIIYLFIWVSTYIYHLTSYLNVDLKPHKHNPGIIVLSYKLPKYPMWSFINIAKTVL